MSALPPESGHCPRIYEYTAAAFARRATTRAVLALSDMMQKDRSKNILWRLITIAIGGFVFLEFSGVIWIELHQLVRSLSLFALTASVLGPALAIAAIVLAIANKYLLLATICAISSLLIFATPLVVFMLGSRLQLVLAIP